MATAGVLALSRSSGGGVEARQSRPAAFTVPSVPSVSPSVLFEMELMQGWSRFVAAAATAAPLEQDASIGIAEKTEMNTLFGAKADTYGELTPAGFRQLFGVCHTPPTAAVRYRRPLPPPARCPCPFQPSKQPRLKRRHHPTTRFRSRSR